MKKIFISLMGGIGNQMFQYATARALALRHGAEVVVDSWSGFVRDYQYRRKYELNSVPIQGRIATPFERLPIWLYRWRYRSGEIAVPFLSRSWYGTFITDITETQYAFLPELEQVQIDCPTWLVGYWQSPLYFQDFAEQIRSELMPPRPTEKKYLVLGKKMRDLESVALGVRIYEESSTPEAHSKDGKVKSTEAIREAVMNLRSEYPNAFFFVFCTHRSKILNEVELPENVFFVTSDSGYDSTIGSLWLMTQCKHHIITNSSYYWWGAWLSLVNYNQERQRILAADNFINTDSICSSWERF